MKPINGEAAPAPDPRLSISRTVYDAMLDEGEPTFDDLDEEDRADLLHLTENYLTAHLNFLSANGFRVVPPGAALKPQSEPEALAMLKAAKGWFDAQKRKGGLAGSPGLILPGRRH